MSSSARVIPASSALRRSGRASRTRGTQTGPTQMGPAQHGSGRDGPTRAGLTQAGPTPADPVATSTVSARTDGCGIGNSWQSAIGGVLDIWYTKSEHSPGGGRLKPAPFSLPPRSLRAGDRRAAGRPELATTGWPTTGRGEDPGGRAEPGPDDELPAGPAERAGRRDPDPRAGVPPGRRRRPAHRRADPAPHRGDHAATRRCWTGSGCCPGRRGGSGTTRSGPAARSAAASRTPTRPRSGACSPCCSRRTSC